MSSDDPNLPPSLAEAIGDLFNHRPEVPAQIDHAILSRASAKFAQRRRMRRIMTWGSAAAIAACLLIAVFLIPWHQPRHASPSPLAARTPSAGQVNMVDAMLLARQLKAGQIPESSWDFNRDGKIDQADVDAIAQAAVSLKQRTAHRPLPTLNELGISAAAVSGRPGHIRLLSANRVPLAIADFRLLESPQPHPLGKDGTQ